MMKLKGLIDIGKTLKGQITHVSAVILGTNGISSSHYEISNIEEYETWKTSCLFLLRQNGFLNESEDFKKIAKKEVSPTNHLKMLAILNAICNMKDDTNQVELIEKLRLSYEHEITKEANTIDAIDAFHQWYNATLTFFSQNCEETNMDYQNFKNIYNGGNGYSLQTNYRQIQGIYNVLLNKVSNKMLQNNTIQQFDNTKIFIVHGHDDAMKLAVNSFLKQMKLKPIILNEQANQGKTTIEKLESHSDVGFAVVLLSPCDKGCQIKNDDFNPRARQNVILELGYFIGKLGRQRVCTLKKSEVEEPSDFNGIVYIAFDEQHDGWQISLAKELKEAGYSIDLNEIIS